MEPLGAKLRRQRRRLGLTLDELAGRTGISKPYLSLIETGRVPNPPSDEKLRRLEQSLGFSQGELISQAHLQRTPRDIRAMLGQLLKDNADANSASVDSSPAAAISNDQTDSETAYLTGILREMAGKSAGDVEQTTNNAVPVINKVTAGYPQNFTDLSNPPRVAGDYVACPDIRDEDAFAVRVIDDSMTPRYRKGDIVIFSPALSPRNGDDCFIRFDDGQTTFKRIFYESGETGEAMLRLQPRNERYRAQIIPSEKAAGLYRAVYRYERVDEDTTG